MERRKPQTGKQLLLRFAEGSDLRDRLDEIAKANGRSTTAEVLLRLEASLHVDEGIGGLSFMRTARSVAEKSGRNDSDLEIRVAALEKAVRDVETRLIDDK